MKSIKGGFLGMVLSVLGIVLFATMFTSVMTAIAALWNTAGAETFTAFQTVLGIAPTVLLLGGIFGAGYAYWRSYRSIAVGGYDPGGLMRMVIGVLTIILFVTLFTTIATSFNTLYGSYSSNTSYIAFPTVLKITPTILLLGGLFAGGATAAGGYKSRRRRRALR